MTSHNATAGTNATQAPNGTGGTPGVGFVEGILDALTQPLLHIGVLLLVAVLGYLFGRLMRYIFTRMGRKAMPTSGRILLGNLLVVGAVALAVSIAITQVYQLNLVSVFATLGIVSVALGFGLQNTVANMAAGVSLSLDKPFDVGDRIQVGQTWGDVISIGLRSTRIMTTGGQHVIIPNAILDTQEVWNNTLSGRRQLRLSLSIGISYGSSIALAEYLALQVARRDPAVRAFPEPQVRVKEFGNSSVDLELRCWIARAEERAAATDRILRGIKEAFDEEGVHFPFPQRTVSYLAEQEPAAPTPEFLQGEAAKKPTILVCTRGVEGARSMADSVIAFVDQLGCRLVVLNVRPEREALQSREAEQAINHYISRANLAKVPAKGRQEVGDLSDVVTAVAREEGARLVIFGRSQHVRFGSKWLAREILETKRRTHVPVVSLDADVDVSEEFVERWRRNIFGPPPEDDEADHDDAAEADEPLPASDDDVPPSDQQ